MVFKARTCFQMIFLFLMMVVIKSLNFWLSCAVFMLFFIGFKTNSEVEIITESVNNQVCESVNN